jgi:hypothetical protein
VVQQVAGRLCAVALVADWVRRPKFIEELFPEVETLPHLICSRPIFIGGANDEADQHFGRGNALPIQIAALQLLVFCANRGRTFLLA